jgi:tetratricopeptide (TPR) repeat protein
MTPEVAEATVLSDLLAQGHYREFVHELRRAPNLRLSDVVHGDLVISEEALQAIQDTEDDGEALYNLAGALWGQSGGELEALEVFRQSLELDYLDAALALGESLLWMGDHEQATTFLKLTLDDQLLDAARRDGLLGDALHRAGTLEEALPYLRRGYVSNAAAFGLPLAETLLALGADDEAHETLVKLVNENVYGAAILLGNLLEERDDHRGAINAYRRGVEQGDGFSAFNLGLVHHHLGDTESASEAFRRARQMGDLTEPPEGYLI